MDASLFSPKAMICPFLSTNKHYQKRLHLSITALSIISNISRGATELDALRAEAGVAALEGR
jgi:hypothetical protein